MSREVRRNNTKIWVILAVIAAVITGCVIAFVITGPKKDEMVYSECEVEAGVAISAADFLKTPDTSAVFNEATSKIDMTVPGEYDVTILTKDAIHESKLVVKDTIPPTADPHNVAIEVGGTVNPEDLVENVTDATLVTYEFGSQVDTNSVGDKKVIIVLKDMGGNTTEVESTLTISDIRPEVTINVNDNLPLVSDFVSDTSGKSISFDLSQVNNTKVGVYPAILKINGENHEVSVTVKDSVLPTVTTKDVSSFLNIERRPEDFIESAQDETQLTFRFKNEPDVSKVGTFPVSIVVTDEGQNEVEVQASLTLAEDTDYPVIKGVSDISVVTGQAVSYKSGVSVTDMCTEKLSLSVDNSSVKINVPGVYPIIYTARDSAGHETVEKCNLTVREIVYSLDEVNAMADRVLARIINPAMSPYDKVSAIFNYVKSHVAYISHSEKGNYIRAAYEGLAFGKGDCYVYASVSKVLLTRAGIPNYDIAKIPASTQHYWNLVDIGSGWLHFDTTPRKDHPVIFLWDDPTMMAYSNQHNKSHNYDHSIYPQVSGSTEGTLVPADPAVANEAALAQYYAALEAQKALEQQAALAEAAAAQQQEAENNAALEQYFAALAQMQGQ